MLLNCDIREQSWKSLGLQGDPTSPRKSVLNIHWKDWCWNWNANTLATWYKELTHWKRPWCWERLKAGREGDDRGWDVWMASLARWTWVWASSRSWWWIGKPGVLQSMGSQRVRHNWVTELNPSPSLWKKGADLEAESWACPLSNSRGRDCWFSSFQQGSMTTSVEKKNADQGLILWLSSHPPSPTPTPTAKVRDSSVVKEKITSYQDQRS